VLKDIKRNLYNIDNKIHNAKFVDDLALREEIRRINLFIVEAKEKLLL